MTVTNILLPISPFQSALVLEINIKTSLPKKTTN